MEAYHSLADRFVAATISDRTEGTLEAPGAHPKRQAWAAAHGGNLVADTFPKCDSAAYGICMLTEDIVEASLCYFIECALTHVAGNHRSPTSSGNS